MQAVASLLHHIRVLTSADTLEFDKGFEHALQVYCSSTGHSKPEEVGQVSPKCIPRSDDQTLTVAVDRYITYCKVPVA